MKKFNNEVYQPLATDLIGDTFYLENRSNTGKISSIRQYTEIIVRRILNYPQGKNLLLVTKRFNLN